MTAHGEAPEKLQTLRAWASQAYKELENDRARNWWDLCNTYPEVLRSPGRALAAFASWHARLLRACEMTEVPLEGLMAGFTALRDRSIPALDLLKHWERHRQAAEERVASPPELPTQEADILAVVLHDAARKAGKPIGKCRVDPSAVSRLRHVVRWTDSAGGASAHVANLLAQLGANVCLINLYHPSEFAQFMSERAHRLFGFNNRTGDLELQPANIPEPSAPRRDSYVVYWNQGQNLAGSDTAGSDTATATGRVIFRDPRWLGQRPWANVRLLDINGTEHQLEAGRGDEWPWLPGFLTWKVEGNTLKFQFAQPNVLTKLVDLGYHYLLLSGIGVASPLGQGPRAAQDALKQQLECLANQNVTIHLEFSGDPDGPSIRPLQQALSGIVTTAGINMEEELQKYTELKWCRFSKSRLKSPPGAPEIYQSYRRALLLAEKLRLERLYVHGNDVDIILRRHGSPGAMRSEVMADVFAKGMVVASLLQRNYPKDWNKRMLNVPLQFSMNAFGTLFTLIDALQQYEGLTQGEVLSLARDGYLLPRSDRPYAVAVVPVFWPTSSLEGIDTTGAGDMTSALSLLFAGP